MSPITKARPFPAQLILGTSGPAPAGTDLRASNLGAAGDSNDRIIYETDTGELCYDADGNGGAAAAIHFATLSAGLSLTHADFVVI
ncbi:hypothetical protein ACSBOB_19230 [Mesorhizobium sp. ASY16-5R]|uniref:hypothetical protein n=1 Tax=Mesorhizobium sp. ASY16-5R TaxID=3445772 RepID=UPI003FA0BA90